MYPICGAKSFRMDTATERENAEKKEKKVTGVYISAPLLKPVMFLLVPTRKNLPVFLPCKRSVPATKRSFSPSAVGAGITHYTLQYRPSNGCAVRWLRSAIASNRFRSSGVAGPHAKSCAKGTLSPLDSLPRNRRFLWILPAKEGSALLWNPPQKAKRNVPVHEAHSVPLLLKSDSETVPFLCHFSD